MKFRFILLSIFLLLSTFISAQKKETAEGNVSYITPQLIYLKFQNTDGISVNDTLYQFVNKNYQPKLLIRYVSSISVACEKLKEFDLKIGDTFFAFIKHQENNIPESDTLLAVQKKESETESLLTPQVIVSESSKSPDSKFYGDNFSGKYSVQSYTNINNYISFNYQSWRHTLRLDYERIGNSDLNFSTYSIFNYRTSEWSQVTKNYFNALKVYDLHLRYDFDKSFQIWLGRFLNPKISNISTVDGLLAEAKLNLFTLGIVGGSRPDWKDFTFNPKLLEYGIYLSRQDVFLNSSMENTISFFQQTNNSRTDRRFLYLQHSNNLIKNLRLFASSEIDLYKREFEVEKGQVSFTSFFASVGYDPIRELSFNLNYDARKNVIYYETFKSFTDSILENETRQGFRIRALVKPLKYLSTSISAGYRYKKSDVKPTRNIGVIVSYALLPIFESGINVSYNKLISNYVNGDVYSVFLSKTFYEFHSDISFGYRKTKYKFSVSENSFDENAVLIDYNLYLFKITSLSISYEGSFESKRTTSRLLIGITTRF